MSDFINSIVDGDPETTSNKIAGMVLRHRFTQDATGSAALDKLAARTVATAPIGIPFFEGGKVIDVKMTMDYQHPSPAPRPSQSAAAPEQQWLGARGNLKPRR